MGKTGQSMGYRLHFEVRDKIKYIRNQMEPDIKGVSKTVNS